MITEQQIDVKPAHTPVVIGYYPFRAKAQVLRLLCEYLHVPYYDRFFNPDDWNRFKSGDGKQWVLKDLPFMRHGDFFLTGNHAMITYVIELSGRRELLGRTIEHQMKIDSFRSKGDLKDTIVGFLCNMRPSNSQQKLDRRKQLNQLYERKIEHLMELHQRECMSDNFYFGYLTILDFSIYQIINYFRLLFPSQTSRFTKLGQIRQRVASLPQIQEYQTSHRAVREFCPITYFKRFKEEKIKALRDTNSNGSTASNGSTGTRIAQK